MNKNSGSHFDVCFLESEIMEAIIC